MESSIERFIIQYMLGPWREMGVENTVILRGVGGRSKLVEDNILLFQICINHKKKITCEIYCWKPKFWVILFACTDQ
jgi:hypothetical protein